MSATATEYEEELPFLFREASGIQTFNIDVSGIDEPALLELSARLPPHASPSMVTASASASSLASTSLHRRCSNASLASQSLYDAVLGGQSPSPARKPVRRPGRRVRQTDDDNEASSSYTTTSRGAPVPSAPPALASSHSHVVPSPRPLSDLASCGVYSAAPSYSSVIPTSVEAFSQDLRSALSLMGRHVFLPLVLSLFSTPLLSIFRSHTGDSDARKGHQLRQITSTTSTRAASLSSSIGRSLAEKFKTTICTSYLLTSSLSISFYESEPATLQTSPKLDEAGREKPRLSPPPLTRPAPRPVRRSGPAATFDAPAPLPASYTGGGRDADLLPRLTSAGRSIRDATLLAVGLLAVLSSTWDSWFRLSLALACLSWAAILILSLTELDDVLAFELLHTSTGSRFLFQSRPEDGMTLDEERALEREALRRVRKLVKSAQAYDVAINKCIGAVQEVEIVSRGYKLTHPLPPISRIEAATSSLSSTSNAAAWASLGSSSRNRQSVLGLGGAAQGARLSRSFSAGGSAASNRKHARRPLSLSLSTGRASPAFSSDSHDNGDYSRRPLGGISFGGDQQNQSGHVPRRLAGLRQTILSSLEHVASGCKDATANLEQLADREELALLKEMYALDTPLHGGASSSDSELTNNEDTSLSSIGGPLTADHDRSSWVATTPRSTLVTSPVGRKRLSLLWDGQPYDRAAGASSAASMRESLASDGLPASSRSPRLSYVTDKSATPGPNDSAASKRLSYISASSAAASVGPRSPASNASPFRAGSPFGIYASPSFRGGEARGNRMSIVGPNAIFNQAGVQHDDDEVTLLDPQTLLGLKNRFERTHLTRRHALCHLLALDFSLDEGGGSPRSAEEAPRLDVEAYWERACGRMAALAEVFDREARTASAALSNEMGVDFGASSLQRGGSVRQVGKSVAPQSHGGDLLGPTSGEVDGRGPPSRASLSGGVSGHLGLEDRFSAMALSLRSVQAKLRVCAEEVNVKRPVELHGLDSAVAAGDGGGAAATAATASDESAPVHAERVQKMFESIKDDLLALSAEWEAGVKIFKKEKRATPASPLMLSEGDENVARTNAARDLESPMEADEDAAKAGSNDLYKSHRRAAGGSGADNDEDEDEDDDDDIAALLLRSTSPQHLPPPGLEQVFESIASIAGLGRLDGPKLSRDERIRQAKLRRVEEQEDKVKEQSHRHTIDPAGIVSELSDVIRTRKANVERNAAESGQHGRISLDAGRYRRAAVASGSTAGSSSKAGVGLGSSLDLGTSASITGVFEGANGQGDVAAIAGWSPTAAAIVEGDHNHPTASSPNSSRRASRYNVANERRASSLYRHLQKHSDAESSDSFAPVSSSTMRDEVGGDSSFLSTTSSGWFSLETSRELDTLDESVTFSSSPPLTTTGRNIQTNRPFSTTTSSFSQNLNLDLEKHVAEFAARKRREAAAMGGLQS